MKLVLVTGSTGKQGRAFISATHPESTDAPSLRVLALTRDKNSSAAKELSLEPHVQVVEGDLDDNQTIKKIFEDAKADGGIWGIFCVLAFPGLGASDEGERRQGKGLVDLAAEYKTPFFVYSSSVGIGTDALAERYAKAEIESHVQALEEKGLSWTIIRPTFFMENFEGTIGSITYDVLKAGLKPDTTIHLIAVDDVGRVAAGIFKNHESFSSKFVIAFGDLLTTRQIGEANRSATGRSLSILPWFVARVLIWINRPIQHLLVDIESIHSWAVDPNNTDRASQIEALGQACPEMKTFEAWASERKGKKVRREKNWNQVSIWRILTGNV